MLRSPVMLYLTDYLTLSYTAVLKEQGIQPSFYSVRWLTTLLSREFNLADTVRLWDSLFADTDRHPFLSYMVILL
jgi:TBC1 domain family member 13